MMTLYGLNQQEWLNLSALCSQNELQYTPLLDLKAKYHNQKAQANITATEVRTKQHYMALRLCGEIASISSNI